MPTGGRMPPSRARWERATTLWRQPSWLPVNAASLLRLGKSDIPHQLAAGCRTHWQRWKRATTLWRQPFWLPVNAASLLRLGKSDTSQTNLRQDAALTGTLEARHHAVEATILVASECSILAAFGKE